MENCDGPIIWIEERRLWYAPWKKKVVGIRLHGKIITLHQPEQATLSDGRRIAQSHYLDGEKGSLGEQNFWELVYEDKHSVDCTLEKYGGDPLPDMIMTAEGMLFDGQTEQRIRDTWFYPYRIVF